MRKVLAVGLAVIMLLCTAVPALAAGKYVTIKVEIPIKGEGEYVLAKGDDPNAVIETKTINGSGSFIVSCDEPADTEYLVYRKGEPQPEKSYLVCVAATVDAEDRLVEKRSVANAATGEKEEEIDYIPDPCWDDTPIQKEIQGTPAFTPGFGFTMTAKDPSNPMPEGSNGISKDISIRGAGAVEFGKITFEKAGVYEYNIVEKNLGLPGCTYDDSVYLIRYDVTEKDGKLSFMRSIYKNGVLQSGLSSVTFVNVFGGNPTDPTYPGGPVKTGDTQNLGMHVTLFIASLTALAVLAYLFLDRKNKMKAREDCERKGN